MLFRNSLETKLVVTPKITILDTELYKIRTASSNRNTCYEYLLLVITLFIIRKYSACMSFVV